MINKTYENCENQSYIIYLRLKYNGYFKLSPDQNRMPIKGEEYFTMQNPGFVWFGKLKTFCATDSYVNNVGTYR